MYDTLLILIFCKNVPFVTLEEQEAVLQFLLNVLLIVVMNCFWVLDSVNCTAFRNMMHHLRLPLIF